MPAHRAGEALRGRMKPIRLIPLPPPPPRCPAPIRIAAAALAFTVAAQAGGLQKDKQLHLAAGAIIAGTVTLAAEKEGRKHPELWGIGAAVLVGLAKEMSDRRKPGNRFDGGDLAATAAGGIVISYSIRF